MKNLLLTRVIVILFAVLTLTHCDKKIQGHPEKMVEEYISAVRKNDFEAIYRLNIHTARQEKFLGQSKEEDMEKSIKNNIEESRIIYQSAAPTFVSGVRWAEKFYFPASSTTVVGKAYTMAPIGDDPVNAMYVMGTTVRIPVTVTYAAIKDAPKYNGKAIKAACYDCVLGKIREGRNVRVYSHDDKWYFSGCAIDANSIKFFSPPES